MDGRRTYQSIESVVQTPFYFIPNMSILDTAKRYTKIITMWTPNNFQSKTDAFVPCYWGDSYSVSKDKCVQLVSHKSVPVKIAFKDL